MPWMLYDDFKSVDGDGVDGVDGYGVNADLGNDDVVINVSLQFR